MKAITIHEFKGCFDGCPYCGEESMGPNYCYHPSISRLDGKERLIVGYSSRSSQIPAGKKHPDWCPISVRKCVITGDE